MNFAGRARIRSVPLFALVGCLVSVVILLGFVVGMIVPGQFIGSGVDK